MTEPTYPYADGDVTVLGPEIFASPDGDVISWKGDNYVRQAPAVSAGVAPATDQTAPSHRAGLRDQLRRAACEAEGFNWDSDMLEPDEYGDHADAVLAVLYREWPWLRAEAEEAATDQAALTARIAAKKAEPAFRAFAAAEQRAADGMVADARRAVHEALVVLAAPEADRVLSLIADLETAVEGRTAMRAAAELPAAAEEHRLALSDALGLGTGAPWDAIHDRATELGLPPLGQDPVARRLGLAAEHRAAVLEEAADRLDARAAEFTAAARKDPLAFVKGATDARYRTADAWNAAAEELRRLAAESAPATTPQPVRHAPGKAILCPDCRAKGYSICTAAESAPADTGAEPCTGRVCAGSGCSHERAADELIAHDQDAGLYDGAPPAPPAAAQQPKEA